MNIIKTAQYISTIAILLSLSNCSESKDSTSVPHHLSELENLVIYSETNGAKDITLIQDKIYGDSDDVFINHVGRLAVDIYGRVYISDWGEGTSGVYVFDSDGSFITQVGREGKGPGEYTTVSNIQSDSKYIYLLDAGQFKIEVFSLESFNHIRTIMIQMDKIKENALRLGFDFFLLEDGSFLMTFMSRQIGGGSEKKILFHRMDSNGVLSAESLFQQKMFQFYQSSDPPGPQTPLPFTMPFTRSALATVDNDGTIYSAWSEEFLVKIYNPKGEYEKALYLPFQNSSLTEGEATDLAGSSEKQKVLRKSNVLDSWPALHFMTLDDYGRIWISTITDDQENYEWWVLDKDGRVYGTFSLSGKKSERIV